MELIFILVLLLFVGTIVFAIVGLVHVVSMISGEGSSRPDVSPPPNATANEQPPSLQQDVVSSRRLLEYLRSTGQLTDVNYRRLVNFLERKFATELQSSDFKPTASTSPVVPPKKSTSPKVAASPKATAIQPPPTDKARSGRQNADAIKSDRSKQPQQVLPPVPSANEDAVERTPPSRVPVGTPAATANPFVAADEVEVISATVASTGRQLESVAPWDRPDPEPRAPRRSFAEVMSGFMQEKNMRWGELTSGILIVLSAVGLVVSLRDQLSDAIPYFSSILFMALTGAIIGAGIYTLKKWKLRNTSRGTLIIGLLLVPLNFVAACVFSGGEERRELSDPWLWAAVIVGVGGFGAMTYWASKFLLRKNNWPLVIGVIGSGLAAVFFNRTAAWAGSSLNVAVVCLPVIACFLIGADLFGKRTREKTHWPPRAANRLYLMLGISAFAVLSALSLLLIRSESQWMTSVAITPVLVVLSLVTGWYGSIVEHGTWNFALRNKMPSRSEGPTYRSFAERRSTYRSFAERRFG